MSVTQKQLARHLGVSPTLIASALNGKGRVSKESRQRIEDAAREMGYDEYSNREARTLAARRYGTHVETRVIGWVFDRGSVHEFYGDGIYAGMQNGAEHHDYDLLNLVRVKANWKAEQEGLQYLDRRTDGLVFFTHGRDELLQNLVRHKVPVATIGMKASPGVAHIKPDNARMAQMAVEYLIKRGHTRIAHLRGPQNHGDYDERRPAFQQAMKRAGLSAENSLPSYLDEHGTFNIAGMVELLESDVTAVVCGNDHIAEVMWRVAQENGREVPRDLSILGMDDHPLAAQRDLSTIRISFPALGRAALDAVVQIIGGAEAESCSAVIPVELIERASVAPPR